jgi:hypothetical protein
MFVQLRDMSEVDEDFGADVGRRVVRAQDNVLDIPGPIKARKPAQIESGR